MEKSIQAFLVLVFLTCAKANFTLPSDATKCNVKDANFSICAKNLFNKLVHMGVKGIPSLNIKPLDPVSVSELCFYASDSSPVSMQLQLKNATIRGFANITIMSANETDLSKNIIHMRGVIPVFRVLANYTMSGKILSIPMKGFGTAEIFLYDFVINYKAYHCPVKKNNQTFLTVRNMTVDTEIRGGNVIYTSDKTVSNFGLSDVDINNLINDNLMDIYEEYEAAINQAVLSVCSPSIVQFNNLVAGETLFDNFQQTLKHC